MSTICPFCKNSINEGASVCASCHAFLSTPFRVNGDVKLIYLFVGGLYLLFGPVMLLFSLSSPDIKIVGLLMFGPITVIGFFVMRAMYRRGSRQLWYRR